MSGQPVPADPPRATSRIRPADADRSTRMMDRFRHTIEIAERREAAREAIRRMRDAIERSRQLLRESGEELKPPNGEGDEAPGGESGGDRS